MAILLSQCTLLDTITLTLIHSNYSSSRVRWTSGLWCSTFPGIEQPNEAYAPVLKKNIAYEQTKKPRGQRIDDSQAPATTEGEYEIIEPVHEYEDVLPKTISQHF